ncbi:hypothetical protein Zmor_005847 [Zophobas morio]|uniref:Uncharacterized protein n=1 Tax=Zophobas morio TaxID=2755281 RepID=A0AA38IWK3_9CUCU|nr:hypothetical protein Zmor_005847 [Zophobas morio]
MSLKEVVLFFTLLTRFYCNGEFVIPEVTLEAYDPKGFRASIPAINGIQMFAFHANVNNDISQVEPGNFSKDFTEPTDGNLWSYYNSELQLKIGDEVNYWIFVQYEKLGYRKDNLKWKVTELVKIGDKPCKNSITSVSGKTLICKDDLVFEEQFNKPKIDDKKWIIEQYIPTYNSLDYEFVSYQNRPEVCFINDNKLFIKPKIASSDNEVNGELDLRGSCTKKTDDECFHKRDIYLIVPPVTSGRIVSRFRFKYGKIEIKAKLPSGDWIYPEVYLEQVNNPRRKLWIAYARGNDKLLANNDEDIGGSLLFSGPVLHHQEPERSQYLKTKRADKPFTSEIHRYIVTWEKDRIAVEVDGDVYAEVDKKDVDSIGFAENDMVQIVLGVGVGGVNDFPDNYRSGSNVKPWENNDNKQVKNFYMAKDNWMKSWKLTTDNRALQVDSIKVWAV